MNPKISDFGMAHIFTHNELEANTNRVVRVNMAWELWKDGRGLEFMDPTPSDFMYEGSIVKMHPCRSAMRGRKCS
ncbi:putative non-specific serine/threonine protein kinase [Rosa chinensis]|uniref:Putative non-specific serine/threonine protein kinase n=1 Tax=Rosa chinensis TaxID=74649 RepID=A0A2P6Q8K0_ROSCH|nr:putative non-specific serine/threonine protein kinase [Rosa chinensis]